MPAATSSLPADGLLAAFLAVLVATALAELAAPAFVRLAEPAHRLRTNIGLGVTLLLSQFVATLGAAALVAALGAPGWGVLQGIGIVGTAAVVATVVLVSLASYLLHVASHRWTWLWRIHRVHHADTRLDITTNFRHHPLEPLIGLVWLTLVALVFGLAPLGLALYGTLALLLGIVSHADLALPPWLDRAIGWLVVTPAFHHVHHSSDQRRTDSNYGDVLSFWDRWFGTRQPHLDYARLEAPIGLGPAHDATAHDMLVQLRSAFRD